MAHQLIGQIVEFTRPVVGYSSEELVPVIAMETVHALVIGVESASASLPKVSLAFLHPDRLHHLRGSGWRDAFERVDRVIPVTDPEVARKQHIAFYRNVDTVVAAMALSGLGQSGMGVTGGDQVAPATPATGRQRRKPGEPAPTA
jgi:hypothetical protein